jgi:hypothetical protein
LANIGSLKCLKGKIPKKCDDGALRARACKLQEEYVTILLERNIKAEPAPNDEKHNNKQ